MALRFKVIDLLGYPAGQPAAITIDCHCWMLRVTGVNLGNDTMDGVPLSTLGSINAAGTYDVRLDFPPVFNADGKMKPWNQVVYFNFLGVPKGASVILVYDDPGLAPSPH